MANKTRDTFLRHYSRLLAAVVVLACLSLMIGCCLIFFSGDGFSRETVRNTFSYIPVWLPVGLAALLVIGGGLLSFKYPVLREKCRGGSHLRRATWRLYDKVPLDTLSSKNVLDLKKRLVAILSIASLIRLVYVLLTLAFLSYAFSGLLTLEGYDKTIAAWFLLRGLPCLVLYLVVWFMGERWIDKQYLKWRETIVACMKAPHGEEETDISATPKEVRGLRTLAAWMGLTPIRKWICHTPGRGETLLMVTRMAVLTLGIAFVILGVMNGGMGDVLEKAIRICTECIGLG